MNTTLKLAALAALVACGTISALPSQADELPKNAVTEKRQVQPFTSIESAGPYRVIIRAQGADSLLRRAVGRSYAELPEVATFVANGLAHLFTTEDHKEAAAAFMEKRPPEFTGT